MWVAKVASGGGNASKHMAAAADLSDDFRELGYTPVPGSLNLHTDKATIERVMGLPAVTEHSEHPIRDGNRFAAVRLNGYRCHLTRYRNVLEAVAPVNLRDHLGLVDGSPVTIYPDADISGCIMAHPKRSEWAESLSARLGVPVVWDRKNSVWDTARRSWLTYDPDASHHVVIQDDAIVCADLMDTCRTIAALMPDKPVVLSTIGYRIKSRQKSYDAAYRWWPTTYGVSSVGLMLPTADIAEMVEHCDKSGNPHDDNRITAWYRKHHRDMWCTKPSLVDHRPADVNPTLVKGNGLTGDPRTALNFIGEDVSGLTIDWSERAPRKAPRRPASKTPEGPMAAFRNRRSGKVVHSEVGSRSYQSFVRNRRLYEPVAEPTPDPEPEPETPDIEQYHVGSGWYELPDGAKVRGQEAATERLAGWSE